MDLVRKLLIANRGEIACRVIRTAKRLGIATVAVYSEVDARAMHVVQADEAYALGGSSARESYLNIDKIVAIAKQCGAQAIHPGYGFLSENAEFCRACNDNNIIFIGPGVDAINAMGSKSHAKNLMAKAGVPLVPGNQGPGYQGEDQSPATLKQQAKSIGYPLLIKASAGGGGKGMRQVHRAVDFDDALVSAKREAQQSFNDDKVILEKYLGNARHVEVQVFCDRQGNGVYLGDRDCSMQRRHQKILEEAPAPGLSAKLRQAMGEAAVRAALSINYQGAGTVEFLLDGEQFYFMEMNTRLQVEHPVTEMISGQDLVEWQLHVAAGESLPLSQVQIVLTGHAIEARIYAEDCDNEFMPCSGKIDFLRWPAQSANVRVDTGVVENDSISSHYDPMIAKLIVWADDRARALSWLDRSLTECRVGGITTNVPFLSRLQASPVFVNAELNTTYVDQHIDEFKSPLAGLTETEQVLAALAKVLRQKNQAREQFKQSPSPWVMTDNWRPNLPSIQRLAIENRGEVFTADVIHGAEIYQIRINGKEFSVSGDLNDDDLIAVIDGSKSNYKVYFQGEAWIVFIANRPLCFSIDKKPSESQSEQGSETAICAPMHGRLIDLRVSLDQEVQAGDAIAVIEAMKMEHTLRASHPGRIVEINFKVNDLVDNGAVLVEVAKKI